MYGDVKTMVGPLASGLLAPVFRALHALVAALSDPDQQVHRSEHNVRHVWTHADQGGLVALCAGCTVVGSNRRRNGGIWSAPRKPARTTSTGTAGRQRRQCFAYHGARPGCGAASHAPQRYAACHHTAASCCGLWVGDTAGTGIPRATHTLEASAVTFSTHRQQSYPLVLGKPPAGDNTCNQDPDRSHYRGSTRALRPFGSALTATSASIWQLDVCVPLRPEVGADC